MSLKADNETFIIRTYFPSGFTVTVNLLGSDKISKVRNECWKKKANDFGCEKNEARIRLYTTEYYLYDNDTISKLVSLYPSFEDLGTVIRYSLLLETPEIKGDKLLRKNMKANKNEPSFWKGYLLKCSKATGRGFWQKRFFVLQSQTLFWYSNNEKFTKGYKAEKYIPLGGNIIPNDEHSAVQHSKKYAFVLDGIKEKGGKNATYVLAAESHEKKKSFIDTLTRCVFYRQSAIILNIMPTLKPYMSQEGIFRIAGESSEITKLQDQIDAGEMPDFATYVNQKTYDNLTGLLKRQLRGNKDPLIPYPFYEAIIDIGKQHDSKKQTNQLTQVVKQLPQTNLCILSQLMIFLKECSKYSKKSKMTSKNLSIVIGPNILRSKEEISNPMKALDDSKYMQNIVSLMIENSNEIFPDLNALYMHDKTTNPDFKYGITKQKSVNNNNTSINDSSKSMSFDFKKNIKPSSKKSIFKRNNNDMSSPVSSPKGWRKKSIGNDNVYSVKNAPTLSLSKKQKDNDGVLKSCQMFEDNMGQQDEIIDYQQEFTTSLLSQIMELAENNSIIKPEIFKKKLAQNFKIVVDAAKKHAQVLTKLNQSLQMIYSEIEDEIDASQGNNNNNYNTPGGNDEGNNNNNNTNIQQQSNNDNNNNINQELYEQESKQNNNNNDNYYQYNNNNVNKPSNPPGTKVAKALFDYPGGYRSNELTFHRGTTLIVTKVKEGWAYGYYELEPSMNGWFPKSYVQEISQ